MNRFAYLLFLLVFVACQTKPTFTVEGHLTNAEGQTLYLEHTQLRQTIIVDSCLLTANGEFSFRTLAPQYPDFYRLRLGQQSLVLAIDSTECISLAAHADSLASPTLIQGSESSQIIAQLRSMARSQSLDQLRAHTQQLIISNPRSVVAYYALFLKVNSQPVWNMADPAHRRLYQAVATSFHLWMPEYERTQVLYIQVLQYMQAERSMRNQLAAQQLIAEAENAFLDIELPDSRGGQQALSQYKGHVIILSFSSTEMDQYVGYNFELRELYNRYHQRGLDIYSVSIDRNLLAWEDAVQHLPWTNVRAYDSDAIQVLTRYNVQSLPTLFLFDKQGNVQGRYTDFQLLDADLQKYL